MNSKAVMGDPETIQRLFRASLNCFEYPLYDPDVDT
jgi:hypothetical protein